MVSSDMTSLVWLRDDLRLDDNPALARATSLGLPMTVVFVLDEESDGREEDALLFEHVRFEITLKGHDEPGDGRELRVA